MQEHQVLHCAPPKSTTGFSFLKSKFSNQAICCLTLTLLIHWHTHYTLSAWCCLDLITAWDCGAAELPSTTNASSNARSPSSRHIIGPINDWHCKVIPLHVQASYFPTIIKDLAKLYPEYKFIILNAMFSFLMQDKFSQLLHVQNWFC